MRTIAIAALTTTSIALIGVNRGGTDQIARVVSSKFVPEISPSLYPEPNPRLSVLPGEPNDDHAVVCALAFYTPRGGGASSCGATCSPSDKTEVYLSTAWLCSPTTVVVAAHGVAPRRGFDVRFELRYGRECVNRPANPSRDVAPVSNAAASGLSIVSGPFLHPKYRGRTPTMAGIKLGADSDFDLAFFNIASPPLVHDQNGEAAISYLRLPAIGSLDELERQSRGLPKSLGVPKQLLNVPVRLIGYGIGADDMNGVALSGTRRSAQMRALFVDSRNLYISRDRNRAMPGDSNAPFFDPRTRVVLGTNLVPTNHLGVDSARAVRLDRPDVHKFLASRCLVGSSEPQ